MSQTPKKEKRKGKPATQMTDAELAEKVFGKRLKKELDKAVEAVDKKGVPDFMRS